MTTRYYLATCGSTYRVVTTPQPRNAPATLTQARQAPHAADFGPSYPTSAEAVARLVGFGSFTEVPDPSPQK